MKTSEYISILIEIKYIMPPNAKNTSIEEKYIIICIKIELLIIHL